MIMSISMVASFRTATAADQIAGCILQAAVTAAFVRSLFVGVFVGAEGVRLSSWFRTWRFDWSELRRSDAVPYGGLITKGIESRLASIIQVTLVNAKTVELAATIGRPRTVARQAAHLRKAIEGNPPTTLIELANDLVWNWDPAGLGAVRKDIPNEYLEIARALSLFSKSSSGESKWLE